MLRDLVDPFKLRDDGGGNMGALIPMSRLGPAPRPRPSRSLSAIIVKELEIGVLLALRRDPAQGALLRAWLDEHVLPSFSERILPVDAVVGMTVVTRNLSDFARIGASVLNPWERG